MYLGLPGKMPSISCSANTSNLCCEAKPCQFTIGPTVRSHIFRPHVSNNDMEVITNGLSDNIALPLKSLDIDCTCTFTTTATRSLVQFITRNTVLQGLKLCVDTFENVNVFVKSLSDNIALPLRTLTIDCKCTFTSTATRSLVQFITRTTTLQCIRIRHVTFNAQPLIELTDAIHHCSTLQKKQLMDLTFCVECSEDVVNLRDMINDHPDMRGSITDWDGVTNVHSSSIQQKASIVSLGLGCGQNTVVSLMNMGISDSGAVALAHALHHNSTLKKLSLSGNDIGRDGTHQLVHALTLNTSIIPPPPFGGLRLPGICKKYVTQCTEYNTVKDRIHFYY